MDHVSETHQTAYDLLLHRQPPATPEISRLLARGDYQAFICQMGGRMDMAPLGASEAEPLSRMNQPDFRRQVLLENDEGDDVDAPFLERQEVERLPVPEGLPPLGSRGSSSSTASTGRIVVSPSLQASRVLQAPYCLSFWGCSRYGGDSAQKVEGECWYYDGGCGDAASLEAPPSQHGRVDLQSVCDPARPSP